MKVRYSHNAENTELHIRFDYDPDLVIGVKAIPGWKFVKNEASAFWTVPIRIGGLEPLQGFADLVGEPLPSGIIELYENLEAQAVANHALSRAEAYGTIHELPPSINQALRPFQRAGVAYIMANKRVMIGDDMGLGKTIQALAGVEAIGGYPCLVICPASLKFNWRREIQKWLPEHGDRVIILNGSKVPEEKTFVVNNVNGEPPEPEKAARFVIVNYDVVGKHQWLWSVPWRALIVDESHYIKNYKAKRTNFVLDLAKNIPNVILLSGTPILNRPIELTAQLSAMGRLEHPFGGFWRFAHRYCGAYKGDYGWVMDGAENLDELNQRLRQTCYIRRDKKSVLTELPDKTRTVLPVEIDNRAEYERARDELVEYIREQGRLAKKFLAALDEEMNRMAEDGDEIGMNPELAEKYRNDRIAEYRNDKAERAARAEVLVGIETLKQVSARGKMAAVKDWVHNFLEQNPDEKLVIFATHKDVIEFLDRTMTEAGTTPLILTGETPVEQRDRMVQLFQTDPDFRVFIANIQAGGVGITLTAASYVLFVEFAWNAATMDQAEDRCYRIGQKNAVNVYWMTGRNTLDEMLVNLIEHKRAITIAAVEGNPNVSMVKAITDYLEKEAE